MKVFYFTGLNFPVKIANRTTIMKTSEALNKLGLDFTLFVNKLNIPQNQVLDFYRVAHQFPIRTLDSDTRKAKSLSFALKYKEIFSREKPDLVFVREPKLTFFLRLLIGKKFKFIYEIHNEGPDRISIMLHRYILPRAAGVVFITKQLEESLLKKYPNLKGRTATALMAFDPTLFESRQEISKEEARTKLGLENRPVVLYIGSTFDKWKGFNFFVDSAGLLPDFNFIAIGGNEKTVPEWQAYTEEKGIKNLNFVNYVSDKEKMFLYYKAADVLISTTSRDFNDTGDSPMKIFEYMASLRPIVAMDGIVVGEALQNGLNSRLIKERSASALAEGIKYVVNNPDFGRDIAQRAQIDSKKFTWETRAGEILNLINKIK